MTVQIVPNTYVYCTLYILYSEEGPELMDKLKVKVNERVAV